MGTDSNSRITRLATAPLVMIRRLRTDLTIVISVAAIVVLTSAFLSVTPRFFDDMSNDALRTTVADAHPVLGNISVGRSSRISAATPDDVFANVTRSADSFRDDEMPPSVQGIVKGQTQVIESPRFVAVSLPGDAPKPFTAFIRMRHQQGVEGHLRLVAGAMPEPRQPVMIEFIEDAGEESVPLYEVAVSQRTLELLRMEIGDRLVVSPDRNEPLFRDVELDALQYHLAIEISGVVEPTSPGEEYWYGDFALHRPGRTLTPDFEMVFATGLMTPLDYGRFLRDSRPALWQYTWRYFVDPDRLNTSELAELNGDLRNLQITNLSPVTSSRGRNTMSTGIPQLIDRFQAQRDSAAAMLSIISIGLFVVSLAVVGVLGGLVAARRRDATYLLRSRGASRLQLIMANLSEGLLLSVPAAGLGFLATDSLVDGPRALPLLLSVAVAIAATITTLVAGRHLIRTDLGVLRREQQVATQRSLRRKVLEATTIVIALASIIALRRRGLLTGDTGGVDPLVAAGPTLLPLAVGLITLRLYLYPIRFVSWLTSKRRGIVAFVGFRRIMQQPPAARVAVLVTLLGVSVATFSAIINISVNEGQKESTWHAVGADYRIAAPDAKLPIPSSLDMSQVEAVHASALGVRVDSTFSESGRGAASVELLALETREYNDVTTNRPAESELPNIMIDTQEGPDIGTESDPIHAIISISVAEQQGLAIGDRFTMHVGDTQVTFAVLEMRERFPGLEIDQPFIVTNLRSLDAVEPKTGLRPSVLYLRAPETALASITSAMDRKASTTLLTSRFKLYDDIHDAPLVAGVARTFRVALTLATVLAAAATTAVFALTSRTRTRDLTYLQTLGLSVKQARRLTIIEHMYPVVVATTIGTIVGIGIASLTHTGIDLTGYTGPGLPAELHIDWAALGMMITILIAVALIAITISNFLIRDEDVSGLLRMGGD